MLRTVLEEGKGEENARRIVQVRSRREAVRCVKEAGSKSAREETGKKKWDEEGRARICTSRKEQDLIINHRI